MLEVKNAMEKETKDRTFNRPSQKEGDESPEEVA
jgi:hypothetical protein